MVRWRAEFLWSEGGFDGYVKQDAENLHLEIQSIENQGQLNTYLSSMKESSMKELNSMASASPKKRHRVVRENMQKQLL